MRYVIYGAGGIGGVLGARLHQSGEGVVLIARGAHHDAVRDRGLRLQSADEDTTLNVEVVDHPRRITWQSDDVVFMAMKSQDCVDALITLREVAPPTITVVSLQNGVANEAAALRFFANVYGVCVMCPTNHTEPGIVQASSTPVTGIFDIGRYPDGVDDTARAIAAAFERSTYVSEPRPDIMRWKYGKLLMNLGNSLDALCGPNARAGFLYRQVRREGVDVLQAAGIDYVDRDEDVARRGNLVSIKPVGGAVRGGGSTWQSLARGLGTVETDYLNGEIVKLARTLGIGAPINALLQHRMAQAVRTGVRPGSVTPDALASELGITPG